MEQENEVSVGNEDFDLAGASAELSESLFGGGGDSGTDDDGPVLEDGPAGDSSTSSAEPSSETTPAAETTVDSPVVETVPAPKTWRPEAAAKWATLPPEVQQEVLKREQDIFKGLETYKADATIGKSINQILAPYTPMLEAAGLNPLQQVEGLMRAHHALATGTPEQKAAFFQRLAQDYNVPLGQSADDANPFVDPQVAALQSQLTALQSKLMEREAREASVVKQSLQKEIDDFASDPAHQYFDEVATDIAGLLQSRTASTLAEAYEKAVWANPVTRAKEQARLTAEAQAKAANEAAAKAEAARKASAANVRTSPKAASATAPLGSIDDTLSAALTAIRSRV
jgi:hypothetical protein